MKLLEESIEINCPIKIDDQVLEINLSRLNSDEKKLFYKLLNKIQIPKAWRPEPGEAYFRINEYAEIMESCWSNESVDYARYSIGNCFKTIDDVLFAIEKLKVEAEIRRYIEANDTVELDWGNLKNHKCYLAYSYSLKKLERKKYVTAMKNQGTIYFSTNIDVDDLINSIGEDRIKKYIFGLEG